jgi:hypothetical protein
MFLRHMTAIRLTAAYFLFAIGLVIPKIDIPETLFDEANTPTNEMVVVKAGFSVEYSQAFRTLVPKMFAQSRRITVRRTFPVYASRLTDSSTLRERFCSLLC